MTMRNIINLASATAFVLVNVLVHVIPAAPALAQTANTMVQPVPLPAQVSPTRPRPPSGNNGDNWNNGNWNNGNNGNWNNGNNGNNGNWNGGNNGNWNGETIRCESRDGRFRSCRADTRGGARLVRQLSNTPCQQGRSWGYRQNEIWVDNGCRGEFQLRYGNGQSSGGGGASTGAIIGGVVVAGGLLALLAQSSKSSNPPANTTGTAAPAQPAPQPLQPPATASGPARITAEMGGVTPNARPALTTCLNEAARQIGATGGTEIRLDRLDEIEPGNGGFRFRFQLKAVYPDETRSIPTFCRATPTKLVELTFG